MAASKGHKKWGGKKAGTKNKKTVESIKRIEWALSVLEKTLPDDIKNLTSAQRVTLWNDLQEYIRPKLQRRVDKDGEDISETTVIIVQDKATRDGLLNIKKGAPRE